MGLKVRKSGLFGVVFMLFLTATTTADERTKEQVLKFGFAADYYSKYIWRGQNINDESVFQPAVSVSAYGFTGSVWGNMDLKNDSGIASDNAWEFSEFDWAANYTNEIPGFEKLNFSVGTIYYRFPNTAFHPTAEVYGGLSLTDGILSPSIKWYRDVDEIDGSYVQFGMGHYFEKIYVVNEKCYCGLQLGTSVGWGSSSYNDGYFGINDSKFNDLTLSSGLCVQIDSWMVRPSINYSMMLSEDIRRATSKSDNIWWGVGLSRSF
jgi:hypothetical protein